jgi:hypothetical protein
MERQQKEAFERALERKHEEAERKGRAGQPGPADGGPPSGQEEQLIGDDRTQDELSVRAKNTGHGKKTADKWNQ